MQELTDEIEREIKLSHWGDEAAVLAHVRSLMPERWELHRTTQLDLDIYFDAEGLPLYGAGATFRIRARRAKPGWKANFKPPPRAGVPYLERREVRTQLTPDEVLLFHTGEMPGAAATLAAELLPPGGRLAPVLYLVSVRRCYTVRPGPALQDWTNFLDLSLDEVTAFDLRGVEDQAILELIRYRSFDCSHARRSTTFGVTEVEANGRRLRLEEEALEAALALADVLERDGVERVGVSKYVQALRQLGGG